MGTVHLSVERKGGEIRLEYRQLCRSVEGQETFVGFPATFASPR